MAARLKETYKSEVAPALMKKFGYKSVMQIPKLDKIVINVGCGEVVAVSPAEGKVIVKKVNVVTKHVKPRKMGEAGGLIDVESALYASKVQLVCPKCNEATRVGHKKGGARICKKCGNEF